jgi:hypothetical protein
LDHGALATLKGNDPSTSRSTGGRSTTELQSLGADAGVRTRCLSRTKGVLFLVSYIGVKQLFSSPNDESNAGPMLTMHLFYH